jgi:hypothetical protein
LLVEGGVPGLGADDQVGLEGRDLLHVGFLDGADGGDAGRLVAEVLGHAGGLVEHGRADRGDLQGDGGVELDRFEHDDPGRRGRYGGLAAGVLDGSGVAAVAAVGRVGVGGAAAGHDERRRRGGGEGEEASAECSGGWRTHGARFPSGYLP